MDMSSRKMLLVTVVIGCAIFLLTACNDDKVQETTPIIQPEKDTGSTPVTEPAVEPVTEPSPVPDESVNEGRTALFPDGISYYDGTERLDSIEGGDVPAHFKKDPNLPYGFYIPETMEEYKLEDGTEWGMDNQRNLFSLFEKGQVHVPYESSFTNPSLTSYKEYAATEMDASTGNCYDYFIITDKGHELVVRLHYFEKEKDTTLPLFLNVLRTMRYVADPKTFQPGVTIDFPKGADEDEEAVIQLVKKATAAIAAKDKAALHETIMKHGDYFDFLIDNKNKYRFTEIKRIAPYNEESKRKDIEIGFEYLEDGVVKYSVNIYTSLKGKDGKWYIASID